MLVMEFLSFGTVNLSFEEMPIDAVSTERYNKGLTAIGEKEIEAMWQERSGPRVIPKPPFFLPFLPFSLSKNPPQARRTSAFI